MEKRFDARGVYFTANGNLSHAVYMDGDQS